MNITISTYYYVLALKLSKIPGEYKYKFHEKEKILFAKIFLI